MKVARISRLLATAALSLAVTATSVLAVAQQAIPRDTVGDKNKTSQPIGDAWITTKVKSELMVADNVPAKDIEVETTNGVVRLSGMVADRAQKDKAVDVAGRIDGVTRVDASALMVQPAR
ncbi:BON domain-containing protein [Pseudoxanthomonas helianthi]|uniref:Osmotically-inducible protein Y n=1 Tax=Pseudoxanthomonas helianthi TaxID=1453541 RepID=A0A941AUN3_9GAMM|nr:BON domain-containing protein [Pseudoxanthomonas helianthi]MBP3983388.1 BON domain-containing protein [Pseudoxanthomonas helianthi]